jgi:site-specific DNA-methyltransferase (adenine-specific)
MSDDSVRLFPKSCESMDELEDGSVSLTVTSPPYWNAIDYDRHAADSSEWFRTREGGPYDEYLDFQRRCFSEVLRVTKPSGFCCIVIGTVLYDGNHYPVPFHVSGVMEELGWLFHEHITWHKVTGGVKRARVLIQKPFPGYFYPNMMTEHILIFRKPGPKPMYAERSREEKEQNRIAIDELFKKEIANNVWHIAPVPPKQKDHPCPFPEEIPLRLILLYSYAGDLVLDPFLGIGATAKVALALDRHAAGYEIKPEYLEKAKHRIREPLSLRDSQLLAVFHKLPTPEVAAASEAGRAPRKKKNPR